MSMLQLYLSPELVTRCHILSPESQLALSTLTLNLIFPMMFCSFAASVK